ncbi:MAG: DUF3866 family protein [Armatimonadota bacterium]
MIRTRIGRVLDIVTRRPGLTRAVVEVEGMRATAVAYEGVVSPLKVGDEVLLNTTAVYMGLGTGGDHFVIANLSCPHTDLRGPGHIMKLRYTPGQVKVCAAEEDDSPHHKKTAGFESQGHMPVVAASVHSALACIAGGVKAARESARVVYVMTDGGALPLALSDLVVELKRARLIEATVTVGHAFGGEHEAVNVYSGLAVAKQVAGADVAVVCMGPGGVGTGTSLGFSGVEQGIALNAAYSLGGLPIAALRISFADERRRHRGVSHHSLTVLSKIALTRAEVAVPMLEAGEMELVRRQLREAGIEQRHELHEIDGAPALERLAEADVRPTSMGRSVEQDPAFFLAAGAAGILAARMIPGTARQ